MIFSLCRADDTSDPSGQTRGRADHARQIGKAFQCSTGLIGPRHGNSHAANPEWPVAMRSITSLIDESERTDLFWVRSNCEAGELIGQYTRPERAMPARPQWCEGQIPSRRHRPEPPKTRKAAASLPPRRPRQRLGERTAL